MPLLDRGAGQVLHLQPFDRRGAFLADRLALARGEGGEEILEAGIAFIVPVELAVEADQPAGPLEDHRLGGIDEGSVG